MAIFILLFNQSKCLTFIWKKFKPAYFAKENLFEEQMEAKLTKNIFEY